VPVMLTRLVPWRPRPNSTRPKDRPEKPDCQNASMSRLCADI